VQVDRAMMREHPKMAGLALKTSVSKGWLLIAPAGSGAPGPAAALRRRPTQRWQRDVRLA
jgi:hypothetical protein